MKRNTPRSISDPRHKSGDPLDQELEQLAEAEGMTRDPPTRGQGEGSSTTSAGVTPDAARPTTPPDPAQSYERARPSEQSPGGSLDDPGEPRPTPPPPD